MNLKKIMSKSIAFVLVGMMISTPIIDNTVFARELDNVNTYEVIQDLNQKQDFNIEEVNLNNEKLANIEKELDLAIYESEQRINEQNSRIAVAPIVVTVAKWLGKVVGAYLAKKLLDWGAKKWCAKYKYHNWATKAACNFLGF